MTSGSEQLTILHPLELDVMMAFDQSRTGWRFQPVVNLTGIVGTVVLVTAVGVLSLWGVLMRKPLGVLRER